MKELQALGLPDGEALLHGLTGMDRGIILDDHGNDTGALKQLLGTAGRPIHKPDVTDTDEVAND